MSRLIIACLIVGLHLVVGDLNMAFPRGSNNRVNEKSATRKNNNRLFNSQVSDVIESVSPAFPLAVCVTAQCPFGCRC